MKRKTETYRIAPTTTRLGRAGATTNVSEEGESEVIMIHMNHFIELKAHSTNSNSVTIVSPWWLFFFHISLYAPARNWEAHSCLYVR